MASATNTSAGETASDTSFGYRPGGYDAPIQIPTGETFVIDEDAYKANLNCTEGASIRVESDYASIDVTGFCDTVEIGGDRNGVYLESVAGITVSGSYNVIYYDADVAADLIISDTGDGNSVLCWELALPCSE